MSYIPKLEYYIDIKTNEVLLYILCICYLPQKPLYLNVRSLEDHILYDSNLYEMYKIGNPDTESKVRVWPRVNENVLGLW